MNTTSEFSEDGTSNLDQLGKLPEIVDILIVGGGPGGTAVAFRAKELGISALVIDFDDLMKRIRDYCKDKLILPGFGGGDKMKFPKGGELVSLLRFSDIDKDNMCAEWKGYYQQNNIPVQIGVELTGLRRQQNNIWQAITWNHKTKSEQTFQARHIVMAIGRGVPRRFDIPGNAEGIAFSLSAPATYVGAPACVIGGGTSAAEAVIAISNAKIAEKDPTAVYWSYRGDKMPRVSKSLADVFFEAYIGNGNIRYYPRSEPTAVVTAEDRNEYLTIRTDRKIISGRPNETTSLEFPKQNCIACIGEDIPESFLNSMEIYMVKAGPNNRKRMVVTPELETRQPNVYLVGDILSQAYFETEDFEAEPSTFREIKHRGNIKAALRDGVLVAGIIAQKLAGKKSISVTIEDAEDLEEEIQEGIAIPSFQATVESEGPPDESMASSRLTDESQACLIRNLAGNVEENEFPIRNNGITSIGRKGSDIAFPEDTLLSDKHASISHGPDGYFLRDDGSSTGVFLRATEARPLGVFPGNIVRAGRQILFFSVSDGIFYVRHFDVAGKEVNRYKLTEKTLWLGRDSPDIILDQNDMTLSRRHLSISLKEDRILIRDLKSVNGTYLKIKNAVQIQHGDQFRVGHQVLNFALKEDVVRNSGHITQMSEVTPTPEKAVPIRKPEKKEVKAGELAVTFKSLGKTIAIRRGQTICEVAEENGLDITAECHSGICGSDPIRIISGKESLNEMGDDEEMTLDDKQLNPEDCRMACMVKPTGPVVVEIIED